MDDDDGDDDDGIICCNYHTHQVVNVKNSIQYVVKPLLHFI